jgi:nucleotide-binding universal stress UspA family protein
MSFRDILVHLDRTAHSDIRLEVAATLAAAHGASLIGLRPETHLHVPETFRAAIRPEALQMQADAIAADSARIRLKFDAAAQRLGLQTDWWAETMETELAIEWVCRQARHASLSVVAPLARDGEEELDSGKLLHALLLGSGRPILVVPDLKIPAAPGRRVALAWNSSREASRVVADAMPILAKADAVQVITVGEPGDGLDPIREHLVRNGVNAVTGFIRGHNVGAALLGAAEEFSADLLVMGGYGHSRMRELVLGGATEHVLHHTGICVLMSH